MAPAFDSIPIILARDLALPLCYRQWSTCFLGWDLDWRDA